MHSLVLAAINKHSAANIALVGDGQSVSYGTLASEINKLAGLLADEQAVAIQMQNCPAWIIADLACVQASVVSVPLPPFFTAEQTEHAMRDSGVSLVITDQPENFQGKYETIELAGRHLYLIRQDNTPAVFPENTAKVTYTSGTTGSPKGVCLTQEAMETVAWSLLSVLGKDMAERHVCLLPLAVLLENVSGVYTTLLAGQTCYLPPVKHEPEALVSNINETKATSCILVPELLRMILAAGQPMPTLRFAAVGGARVDPALLKLAHERNIPVYEGYGMSEASSVLTVNTPPSNTQGSAGRPLPHVQIAISPQGEIMIRDPLFSGYLGDGEYAGVWYATGDLGHFDKNGFLHIDGRKRNVFINSFGRNVSPEWPESLLNAHPAILQSAVYGEAQPYAVAVIVPRPGQDIKAALQQVNSRLPDYAQIGACVIADEPFSLQNGCLTGTGRVRRDAIYAVYAREIEKSYRMEKTA